jgi:hypothetical protein
VMLGVMIFSGHSGTNPLPARQRKGDSGEGLGRENGG